MLFALLFESQPDPQVTIFLPQLCEYWEDRDAPSHQTGRTDLTTTFVSPSCRRGRSSRSQPVRSEEKAQLESFVSLWEPSRQLSRESPVYQALAPHHPCGSVSPTLLRCLTLVTVNFPQTASQYFSFSFALSLV